MELNRRIMELEEKETEFILNEAIYEDDNPSWGELAKAQGEAKHRWDETDEGKELKSLLELVK